MHKAERPQKFKEKGTESLPQTIRGVLRSTIVDDICHLKKTCKTYLSMVLTGNKLHPRNSVSNKVARKNLIQDDCHDVYGLRTVHIKTNEKISILGNDLFDKRIAEAYIRAIFGMVRDLMLPILLCSLLTAKFINRISSSNGTHLTPLPYQFSFSSSNGSRRQRRKRAEQDWRRQAIQNEGEQGRSIKFRTNSVNIGSTTRTSFLEIFPQYHREHMKKTQDYWQVVRTERLPRSSAFWPFLRVMKSRK